MFNIGKEKGQKYSEDEIQNARIQNAKQRYKYEEQTQAAREYQAAQEAKAHRGNKSKVLGKCVANIPAREFMRLREKYGHQEIHSNEFLNHLQRSNPHLSGNKL